LLTGAVVPVEVVVPVPVPVLVVGPVVRGLCGNEAEAIPVGVMLSLVEVDMDTEVVGVHTRIGKPP
jgi:hypothetical protein